LAGLNLQLALLVSKALQVLLQGLEELRVGLVNDLRLLLNRGLLDAVPHLLLC
jgi:hypothetical protein